MVLRLLLACKSVALQQPQVSPTRGHHLMISLCEQEVEVEYEELLLLQELLLLVELLADMAPTHHLHLSLYVKLQNKHTNMLESVQGLPLVRNVDVDGGLCV